jgi:NAD(P)-dependent dehydrogenase (short-subunit alcohol dehydrogenase family)
VNPAATAEPAQPAQPAQPFNPGTFTQRTFIVTGAASGIGAGISKLLAELGGNLVMADLDLAGLEKVANEISATGAVTPIVIAGDQTDSATVDRTAQTAVTNFGGINGIVANAGVGVTGKLSELSDADWHKGLLVNLTSAFYLTRAAMQVMIEKQIQGSLIFIASKNAFGPGAAVGAYSVAKAGMVQLMRIAALEGGKHGIRSNAINPDAVFDNSKLWDDGLRRERAAVYGIKPEELEDFYATRNLLNRRVTTRDVALTTAFLLSDAASRTTGSVIPVDGGVATAFPR